MQLLLVQRWLGWLPALSSFHFICQPRAFPCFCLLRLKARNVDLEYRCLLLHYPGSPVPVHIQASSCPDFSLLFLRPPPSGSLETKPRIFPSEIWLRRHLHCYLSPCPQGHRCTSSDRGEVAAWRKHSQSHSGPCERERDCSTWTWWPRLLPLHHVHPTNIFEGLLFARHWSAGVCLRGLGEDFGHFSVAELSNQMFSELLM